MPSGRPSQEFFGRIGQLAEKIAVGLQVGLVFVAVGFIVAWAFPPIRQRLKYYFDEEAVNEVVALALILTLGLLAALSRRMGRISRAMETISRHETNLIVGGVGAVYPHLKEAIDGTMSAREKTLDVLGLTLYTAWPHIHAWISNNTLRNWRVRIWCLDPNYIDANPSCFPRDWADRTRAAIVGIQAFRPVVERHGVHLEIDTYRNFPAVHGFRIGSGDLFVSFICWAESGRIADPFTFYDRFPPEDRSARAREFRTLFANWSDNATGGGKPSRGRENGAEATEDH